MTDPIFSNSGLHRIYSVYGRKYLDRGVNVPEISLAIGPAEVTRSIPAAPLMIPVKPPQVRQPSSVEDAYVKTVTPPMDMSTFGTGGYLGPVMGGY